MRLLLAILLAYGIGSIPWGYWIGRWVGGIDVREHGSGNIGATNVARVLGKKWGFTTFCLDVLKGLVPVALFPSLFGLTDRSGTAEILLGAAAVVGHCYSPFLGFTGGKGVATALGVFLAIATLPVLILAVVAGVLIAWKGYISLAAIVCAALLPFLLFFFDYPWVVLLVGELLAALVIYRHRGNIQRLLAGTESRVWDGALGLGEEEPIPTTVGDSRE
ncbi:MAG: glycerol-3-phosphate 1-O-acyltransferase PlsY [Candidatus Sumerlaea chitinivorans]|nr:glycerol-3-phosphate 1-O-acyltransferase PlsY [Candidatus Sumerlaea chitinivorans]